MNTIDNLRNFLRAHEAWGDLGKALDPRTLNFGRGKGNVPATLGRGSKTERFSIFSPKEILELLTKAGGPLGVEIRIGDNSVLTVWKKGVAEYNVSVNDETAFKAALATGGTVRKSLSSRYGPSRTVEKPKYETYTYRGELSSSKLSTLLSLLRKYSSALHEPLEGISISKDPERAAKAGEREKARAGHPMYAGSGRFYHPSGFKLQDQPLTACCGAPFKYGDWESEHRRCENCNQPAAIGKMVSKTSTKWSFRGQIVYSSELEHQLHQRLRSRLEKYRAEKAVAIDSPAKLLKLVNEKGYLDKIRIGNYAYRLNTRDLEISLSALMGKNSWARGMDKVSFKYEFDPKNPEDWSSMRWQLRKKISKEHPDATPEEFERLEKKSLDSMPPYAFYVKFALQGGSIVPSEVHASYSEYAEKPQLVPQAEALVARALGTQEALALGDLVRFNLNDITPEEFGVEYSRMAIEELESCNGREGTVLSEPIPGYYDVLLTNGKKLHAVSEYNLDFVSHLVPGVTESRDWVTVSITATVNLAYRLSKNETRMGDMWFEEISLWLDKVNEPDDENEHLCFIEATAFSCPSVEEVSGEISRDLKKLGVSDEEIKKLATQLQSILKSAASELSPNPIPEENTI